MKIHIIQHESFEGPGAIEHWTLQRKFDLSYTRLFSGDTLPENAALFDFLIIMGGPQSPATRLSECHYFDAKAEIALLKKVIAEDKCVLGICLGAQLLGEAFGARFEHSPNKEIGIFDIHLTSAGSQDPFFSTQEKKFPVGHWHGDMPGLPHDARLLAYSEACPRQIVRYANKVYGFQCHFEFTSKQIEEMIKHCSEELKNSKDFIYVQDVKTIAQYHFQEMNGRLFGFLDYMVTLNNGETL